MSAHAAGAHRGRRVRPWHKEWTVAETSVRVLLVSSVVLGGIVGAVVVTGWLEGSR